MAPARDECADDCPPEPSDGPGALLRRARLARGLTLDDLSARTKIPKATLTAIEEGDAARLPAAIYTRGFVKVFAREVGLDPESTADEYLRAFSPLTPHDTAGEVRTRVTPPAAASGVEPGHAATNTTSNEVGRFGRLTIAAAAIGLLIYVFSFSHREDVDGGSPVDTRTAANGDAVVASLEESTEVEPADRRAARGGPFELEIVPKGPCWVSVVVDGERVLARLLQSGERQMLTIDEQAVMRIGEPGALSISINGQPGRALGQPGQPVNVTITRDNFREFLSS